MLVVFAGPTGAHVWKYSAKVIDVVFHAAANVGRNFDRDKGAIGRHGLTTEDTEEAQFVWVRGEALTKTHQEPRINTNRDHEFTRTNNLLPGRENNNLLRGTLDRSFAKWQRSRCDIAPVVQLIFPMRTVWSS